MFLNSLVYLKIQCSIQIRLLIKCLNSYAVSPFINLFSLFLTFSGCESTNTFYKLPESSNRNTTCSHNKNAIKRKKKTCLFYVSSPNLQVFFFFSFHFRCFAFVIELIPSRLQAFLASLACCFVILLWSTIFLNLSVIIFCRNFGQYRQVNTEISRYSF